MAFSIVAPDGSSFLQTTATLAKTQDQLFSASGRKLHKPLATGTYLGTINLMRSGKEAGRIATRVAIP